MGDNAPMGQFDASLVIPGDSEPLLAILLVEDGRLRIRTDSHDIGDWSLREVTLTSIPGGFRMEVEGEELIVEIDDHDRFNAELTANTKKGRRRRRIKDSRAAKAARQPEPLARRAAGRPAKREKRQTPPPSSGDPASQAGSQPEKGSRKLAKNFGRRLDRVLDKAEKRYGPVLPPWVFTRGTTAILGLWLLLLILLPSLISAMLMITGFLAVGFGAVLYTDDAFAARVLPGRSTPNHLLIGGVGLVALGFLLGMIAN